ncbi:MAG: NUDIX hydrolase [Candidatus Obscuribacterales bacterium]|nr:NUDIX hydrolase [Candidatus Obscuribacterales bacterium]
MDQTNPWKTTNSKVIYENPWIRLRENQVIQPDGKPGIYGLVHFKSKAVGVLAIDEAENVHLIGQYRYALDLYSWEIPEGGCPENEDPLEAAQRELKEETGFEAKNWQYLGQSHLSNSVSDEIAIYFLATGLSPGIAMPEGTEKLIHKIVPFDTALKMVLSGEITDAISVMAILHYALIKDRA